MILKNFQETIETIKSFKFWETDQVGKKNTRNIEAITLTDI